MAALIMLKLFSKITLLTDTLSTEIKGILVKPFSSIFLIISLILLSPLSNADGLSDLKAALSSLNNNSSIAATLMTTSFYQQGEGKDKITRNGIAEIFLNDDEQGLQVTYSQEILTKLEQEASEQIKDENAETPTLNAIDKNRATEIKSILSAAPDISRTIAQASFVNEVEVNIDGKILRKLNFELPVSAIINDKRTREYVSKFQSNYSVIINDEGVPLSSQLNFNGKGRAYIVLSVKAQGFEYSTYQVLNQRLVRVTNESGSIFDSTFGYSERKNKDALTFSDNQNKVLALNIE